VGQRVSFFVIVGDTYDQLYEGYRLLTGSVPMLPKSAYGYIQCKQRYASQQEILDVAHGYRDRPTLSHGNLAQPPDQTAQRISF
jgi:alpha-D-xyloside xylohydrolase